METIDLQNQAKFHLAILGVRQLYHATAKNYSLKPPQNIKNEFLKPEEVIQVLFNWNNNGFTTWLSINDKEQDKIEGVKALQDFWLDIDARPKGIDDRQATSDEMHEALQRTEKIKGHIENEYAAIGFTACSGNGFHIHFPLPRFEIPPELREQVNKKVRAFAKKEAKVANVKIDNTYDISRRTTLIGTQNKKLETPIATSWNNEYFEKGLDEALKLIDHARTQNKALLSSILSTEEPKANEKTLASPKENHIDIEQLCQTNKKVYDLFKVANKENEKYKEYGYPSRSEAEAALITILVMEGFGDQEINDIMQNCSLGKWQEKENSYRILTIEHARQQASKYIKNRETQNILMEEISGKNTEQKEKISLDEINPVLIAKRIVENYTFKVDKDTKILWVYDKQQGIYTQDAEDIINTEIVRLLDNHARKRFYADVDYWIRYATTKVKMNAKPELIGVQNGVLNVLTRELIKFEDSKDCYVTVKIPWLYNKESQCPKILQFLSEILEESQQKLAQEFIGYCLYNAHPYRKAYIANGPTGTGKTVHQNINTSLLGEENVSNQSIQNLNHNRFAPAELYNKMGNFCDDMPANIVKITGNFKMATGGGRMAAERKGKDPFYFRNRAKLWLNCNQLAPIQKSEDCDAYYERLIIIDYTHQMKGKENPNLFNELNTPEEMSGYLNYALDGLERLTKQKHFSETMTKEDVRACYIKRTDSAKYYVETHIIVTDKYEDWILHEELFQNAVKVCHNEKIKPMNKGELINAVQQYCPGAQHTKIRPDPKQSPQSAWRYIKIVVDIPKEDKTQKKLTESVPTVPRVPPPEYSARLFEKETSILKESEKAKSINELQASGTDGTLGTDLMCGDCGKFRLPSCSYPGDCEKVAADHWAGECRAFLKKQPEMSNHEEE